MEEPPSTQFRRLCEICESATHWITSYTPKLNGLKLRYISDARRNIECPLCAFLVSLTESRGQIRYDPRFWLRKDQITISFWMDSMNDRAKKRFSNQDIGPVRIPVFKNLDFVTKGTGFEKKEFCRHRLGSTIDYDQIKRWITQCEDQHCHQWNPLKTDQNITSLIDSGGFKLVHTESLEVHTVESNKPPSYVALSYVWGQKEDSLPRNSDYLQSETDPQVLHKSTLRLNLDLLPRTLREAILLARDLGQSYIWIDELCIDQTHSSHKSTAIGYMGAIYAAADLVIIAAASDDATAGLPGTKTNTRLPERPPLQFSTAEGLHMEFARRKDHLHNRLEKSTWSKRGRTFQEYVFARRALMVFPDEMFFVCADKTYKREAYSSNINMINDDVYRELKNSSTSLSGIKEALVDSRSLTWETYTFAVEDYTRRRLTFEKDRLDAFKGILSEVGDDQDEIALSTGLPMRHFADALTWFLYKSTAETKSRAEDIAPSCSWASVGQPVWYPHFNSSRDVNGIAYEMSKIRNNIVGRPHDRYLISKSYLKTDKDTINSMVRLADIVDEKLPVIHLVTIVFYAYLAQKGSYRDLRHYGSELVGINFEVDEDRCGILKPKSPVFFAVVSVTREESYTTHYALLLRQVEGYYERVGIAKLNDRDFVAVLKAKVANPRWDYIKLR
ncbi:heterokaryon incompatibility protein-domain-containing protein [Biscogniauxia marginata]|nr:heterokaryon incompatibility protein-domain-containing protein [Biscogniauxia marginata]